jgi:hypothetical protein
MASDRPTGENSMNDTNPTTRKYPRTLQEAFPHDPKWREHDGYKDDMDMVITILGLVFIALTLVLTWLGH